MYMIMSITETRRVRVRVTRSLILYACFVDRRLSFVHFSPIVLSVRYTDSDCPFRIFKLFFDLVYPTRFCNRHNHVHS
jgi:hypothetical protein